VNYLCTIHKNAIAALLNEVACTPAKLRLCAAHGTNQSNAFLYKIFACTPLYLPATFPVLLQPWHLAFSMSVPSSATLLRISDVKPLPIFRVHG
jgi:hypothetical protein